MQMKIALALALALCAAGCAVAPAMPSPAEVRALAPTGQLRLGFQANNAHATRDAATGEFRGPAIDFGRELAHRLGVRLVPIQYATVTDLIASLGKGEADVLSIGINPERQLLMAFSPAYSQMESGYLVGPGSRLVSADAIDQQNTRIAVLQRGDNDVLLSRTLRNAELLRTRTFAEALDLVKAGKADAMAFLKTGLYPVLADYPGSRILDGTIQIQLIAIAVQKDNGVGAGYIGRLVEQLKNEGFVRQSIDRAAVKGLMPAP